LVYMVM